MATVKRKILSNGKARINIRLDKRLDEWLREYTEQQNTNISQVIIGLVTDLRKKIEEGNAPQI